MSYESLRSRSLAQELPAVVAFCGVCGLTLLVYAQELPAVVAFCGDGANDCGALKVLSLLALLVQKYKY